MSPTKSSVINHASSVENSEKQPTNMEKRQVQMSSYSYQTLPANEATIKIVRLSKKDKPRKSSEALVERMADLEKHKAMLQEVEERHAMTVKPKQNQKESVAMPSNKLSVKINDKPASTKTQVQHIKDLVPKKQHSRNTALKSRTSEVTFGGAQGSKGSIHEMNQSKK